MTDRRFWWSNISNIRYFRTEVQSRSPRSHPVFLDSRWRGGSIRTSLMGSYGSNRPSPLTNIYHLSFSTNLYRFYIVYIYTNIKGARASESFWGSRPPFLAMIQLLWLLISSLLSAFLSLQPEGEECHSPAIGFLVIVWLVTEGETPSQLRFPHWILSLRLSFICLQATFTGQHISVIHLIVHVPHGTYRGS